MALAQEHNYVYPSGTSLQRLPVELVSMIIEQVDSPSDLIALCLVSKTFYSLAKPKLWRSIILQGLETDGFTKFANTMTTLLSSSADNLRCVKELDVLVLDCDYAFDVVTGSHVDPLIRLSNHFIALALQRMTELRSFFWDTCHPISRLVLESLQHCHHLQVLRIEIENIDFPCPEPVPPNHRFPDIQSLLCAPQFIHLVKIAFLGIPTLPVLQGCCQLASQCKRTLKYLCLSFPRDWIEDDYFGSELLPGAVPLGSWEDPHSCNLREITKCVKEVVQSVRLVSLELVDFVWELSMLQLPRCIFLPTLKHLNITGRGSDDFFRVIAERIHSEGESLHLTSLELDGQLLAANLFIKGFRDLQCFSFTGTCHVYTPMIEELCLSHARTMERLKIVPSLGWDPTRPACTPGEIGLLAKSMRNIRELQIETTFVDGWAVPFKGFHELRLLLLSCARGFNSESRPNTGTILKTVADAIFNDDATSREHEPKLEYVRLGRYGVIYQPVKYKNGRYKFQAVGDSRVAQLKLVFGD